MESARCRLGVTLGDPRGIGPEVAAAAARSIHGDDRPELVFFGPPGSPAAPAADTFVEAGEWAPGPEPGPAGAAAAAAIEEAVRLVTTGRIDALVTAPIDKSALAAAGYSFPGHTEMLAGLTDTETVGMLMAAEHTSAGGPLRVLLATTHIALAAVPAALTACVLVEQASLCARSFRERWGITSPRLALCALNPHASDGGLFGDEEARVYEPALAELRARGEDVAGPIPADTVFVRALRGEFDAVVAPYHDVGMAAFKTASFGRGVNVTLGLPFVRTSPDHGTALDIAGRGLARPDSMIEAIRLAQRLVRSGAASRHSA